ncbi:hypothetical protein AGDE_06638 [Angomonas deanei]|nr:hypothetical protein AGDE_06638 [Angomonas deanei]|eukprot:EPY36994.1 hypothetical protein AGDE_06638 [Angomonas deanei]
MKKVKGVGLSGQMHGSVLLDKSGHVIRPCILWCDGRCAAECKEIERNVPTSRTITGNIIMPGFTAGKLLWVKKNEPENFEKVDMVLLPKDYLRFCMSGGVCVRDVRLIGYDVDGRQEAGLVGRDPSRHILVAEKHAETV